MYSTPVYLVSPICQGRALMSKGCIHKALVEMSLCPSMTQDREGSPHEWLKEVSVPTCSLLVTKMSRDGLGVGGCTCPPARQACLGRTGVWLHVGVLPLGTQLSEFVQMPVSHFAHVVPCRYWVTLTMLSQPSLLLKSC